MLVALRQDHVHVAVTEVAERLLDRRLFRHAVVLRDAHGGDHHHASRPCPRMPVAVFAGYVEVKVARPMVLDAAHAYAFARKLVDDLLEQHGLAGVVVAGERNHELNSANESLSSAEDPSVPVNGTMYRV